MQAGDLLQLGAGGVGREQGDEAARVAGPGEAPEHGGEAVLPREPDAGERLHDRLELGVAGAVAGVDPVGRHEPHERAPLPARGHDARRRRHRQFEGFAAVGPAAHIEEHGDARLPRHLVLPDHELVEARRRRPVHATQVVAYFVGAQRVEVLTGEGDAGGVVGTGERVVAARMGQGGDVVDVGVHGELAGRGHLDRPGCQTEGIGDAGLQRSEREDAAPLGRQPVGGAGRFVDAERGHEEAGLAPAAVERVAEPEYGCPP